MRKNIEISDEKINEFLEQFYSYFESGYAFEEFLKVYLEKIGLDEVVVTQRSSDGGIDLEAVRYGVGGFAGADAVDYFVQAKRNKPGTTIPIEKVRALRGVMPSGSSLSWFYSGIGYELVLNDIAIVDEELIKKAASLIGYESDNDFANGLADVIENSSGGEDKFIASLVLAKEIARTLGGRAVIIFD